MTRYLILGGTKEAAEIAEKLVSEGHEVTTSLAGRTKEPKPLCGNVRIGGFGGIDGMISFLKTEAIEAMIDATHPFAKQISFHSKQAAKATNIPLDIKIRPPWTKYKNDNWLEVKTLEEARDLIPIGARVLLALGSQHIDVFAPRCDVFFLVRRVDKPEVETPLKNYAIILGKPSLDWREEAEIIKDNELTHIVCRNSGGDGAYAKIEAARTLGLPVIIVAR